MQPTNTLPRAVAPRDRFYARTFALAAAVILGIAFYRIIQPFLGPLVWAMFIAFLLNPLHRRLTVTFRNKPQMSAFALTMLTLVVFVGPLTALSAAFASQVGELIQYAQNTVADRPNVLDVTKVPWVRDALAWLDTTLDINTAQVRGWFVQGTQESLQWLAGFGGKVFVGAIGTVFGFVLMLFILFFFVRDGDEMLATTKDLIPMSRVYKQRLFDHVASVTRAMVIGTGVTALIQGALVGISFLIVGLPSPLVFGVIAAIVSLLPFGGTALVWVPAALALAGQGRWGATIFMVVWGAALVSLVDNVVRPMLVSRGAKVGTLTVFIGVLGGIAAFGAIGLFLGPVVLALIIALIRLMLEVRRSESGGVNQ
ncbi:MAG: AI-2E family transporter [Steroidobacteraceae bacterium]